MGFVPLMSEIEAPNRKPLNFLSLYTLPEINIALKMDGWNTIVSFLGWLIFRGELLVSGRGYLLFEIR